ncbi:hypothetical protein NIES2104_19060 [Leptolyngbya sp. NIES-2104]|nr:hypothetical protein NIES2104_19060 [Leptolyngbya sp. NIES-2104]
MNRFIAYSRKSSNLPFLISIYRDYRTYSGYGAVAYSNLRCSSIQRTTQHQPILKKLS